MNIEELLTHEDEAVRGLAARAVRWKQRYDAGEITTTEYEALCRQMVSMRALNGAATTAELKLELQQVAQVLRAFLGVVL